MAVVIPCFRVRQQILHVIEGIPQIVDRIYVVDDGCPESTGELVGKECGDPRVRVLFHAQNLGVGAATLSGYRRAMEDKAEVLVKVDGDGQMDPSRIGQLVEPIVAGRADYAKGNRFEDFEALRAMPRTRLFGNSILSFLMKLASGYWDVMDPTNGFTAIRCDALNRLQLSKVATDYFFESDLLIRLGSIRAVIESVPMPAEYGEETSSLGIWRSLVSFPPRIVKGLLRRVFFRYFIYDFNMASVYLILGIPLVTFGLIFGAQQWVRSIIEGVTRSGGTIMLVALPIIVGVEMLVQALAIDINSVPRKRVL